MPDDEFQVTPDDELLTTPQLSDLLKVSKRTVESWRMKPGYGPPYEKCGPGLRSPIRYRRSAVEEWLRRNTEQGSQTA